MSRFSIDDLEVLTPDQLGELLILEVQTKYPNIYYIQDLIDVGCTINFRDHIGRTAFYCSAIDGKFSVMKSLISNGADIHVRDNGNRTAWEWLARLGSLEVIEFLVSIGVDVNYSGFNEFRALHWAAFNGHQEVVEFLISNGADINAKNIHGITAWDDAYSYIKVAVPELKPK